MEKNNVASVCLFLQLLKLRVQNYGPSYLPPNFFPLQPNFEVEVLLHANSGIDSE